MALDSDAGPYGEHPGHVASLPEALFKRPAMLLGNMANGDAFAGIVRQLVNDVLSWRIGASLSLRLMPGNLVTLACHAGTPQEQAVHEHRWCRPLRIVTQKFAILGAGDYGTQVMALGCSQMNWEIRDRFGKGTAAFEEGRCHAASHTAPALPDDLCLRVSMVIGTERLTIAAATMDQVATALQFMSGPAEAGYWGCISLTDDRTNEKTTVIVTDSPRR
jgi:hypothetical protein